VRAIFFTQTTDSNTNPFRNTLADTPILPDIWAFLSQVKVTHKVSYHRVAFQNSELRKVHREYELKKKELFKKLCTSMCEFVMFL
jgi:hypothetical protein